MIIIAQLFQPQAKATFPEPQGAFVSTPAFQSPLQLGTHPRAGHAAEQPVPSPSPASILRQGASSLPLADGHQLVSPASCLPNQL